jgi:hypothetical protein
MPEMLFFWTVANFWASVWTYSRYITFPWTFFSELLPCSAVAMKCHWPKTVVQNWCCTPPLLYKSRGHEKKIVFRNCCCISLQWPLKLLTWNIIRNSCYPYCCCPEQLSSITCSFDIFMNCCCPEQLFQELLLFWPTDPWPLLSSRGSILNWASYL